MTTALRKGLLALTLTLAACEERVVFSGWEGYGMQPAHSDATHPRESTKRSGRGSKGAHGQTWAINLDTLVGPDHAIAARQRQQALASITSMGRELWVADEAWRSQVYYGRYGGPGDPQADKDLAAWRDLRRRGVVSVPLPILVPTVIAGSAPAHNLAFIAPPAEYTFQLAHFDGGLGKGKDFRRAAEEHVARLRREGLEAYYYHGPESSNVTLGVFGPRTIKSVRTDDGLMQVRITDPNVSDLMQRFPILLVNGVEHPETATGLVRIPR